MKRIRAQKIAADIPTSSMADIAFLLIIFFMVTAVFAMTHGMALNLPEQQAEGGSEGVESILIHVQPGRVVVDCVEVAVRSLADHIRPMLMENSSRPVILYTDGDASYQEMVAVYDVLLAEGEMVREIFVPQKSDIQSYREHFDENPYDSYCE